MIKAVKNITTADPQNETWKYLRYFLDSKSVTETIRITHKIPKGKFNSDVEKQARQIGYCIRQAEEYFRASSQVGLATRPTLLYYGAVSLSQALVLLRQTGEYSFDALRRSNKHHHHGLELKRGLAANARLNEGIEEFYNSLQCECYVKGSNPWGHFPLVYNSLVSPAFYLIVNIDDLWKPKILQDAAVNSLNLIRLDSLISNRFNAFEILKTLPDLYFNLLDLGVQPDLRPGRMTREVFRHFSKDNPKDGSDKYIREYIYSEDKQLVGIEEKSDHLIYNLSPKEKESIEIFYKGHYPFATIVSDLGIGQDYLYLGPDLHLITLLKYHPDQEEASYTNIIDDVNGNKFYLLKFESYLPEPAAFLVLFFCLGMLSRYYPDIWMKAIDTNVQVAEFTNSLLNIGYRKFPNLILDQMTHTKHYIHL